MKIKINALSVLSFAAFALFSSFPHITSAASNSLAGYVATNLVSNVPGAARREDPVAINSWGLVASPRAVWVNQTESGVTSSYGPLGQVNNSFINIPGPAGSTNPGSPTGLILNDTRSFVITNGHRSAPAELLMATEEGTIVAWERRVAGDTAITKVDLSASYAVYKGLAIVRDTNGAPLLCATDFHNKLVHMFDGSFHFVRSFTDPDLPPDYAPFNVRSVRGHLFVTFAKQSPPENTDDEPGAGNGYVDIFDTDGTVLRRFASRGALNSPWGLAVAPRNFGKFSHALLVGNFGDGRINAYDLISGKHLGPLTNPDGTDLIIEGLWGLAFEKDEVPEKESMFTATRLYYTAGPNDEANGVMGYIRAGKP